MRILVVDDEPLMGAAIARVLSDHEVVALTSARLAMTRIRDGEQFDLIFCDVMMPGFSGMDLYAELGRLAPDQVAALVFMTGGAYTPAAIAFLDQVPNARLEKPILAETLQEAVANALKAIGKSGGLP